MERLDCSMPVAVCPAAEVSGAGVEVLIWQDPDQLLGEQRLPSSCLYPNLHLSSGLQTQLFEQTVRRVSKCPLTSLLRQTAPTCL